MMLLLTTLANMNDREAGYPIGGSLAVYGISLAVVQGTLIGPAIRAFGEDVVTALCTRLLEGGAPGLHFYTLNRANATLKIWQRLKTRGLL